MIVLYLYHEKKYICHQVIFEKKFLKMSDFTIFWTFSPLLTNISREFRHPYDVIRNWIILMGDRVFETAIIKEK